MSQTSENPYSIDHPHTQTIQEVYEQLETNQEGLTDKQAHHRLTQAGYNRLPTSQKESVFKRFFKHFHDTLIYILIVAAMITGALGHWIDTLVIMAVVVINAVIGFIQEGRAEVALEGIRKMLSAHAHTKRDGQWKEIEAEELVPGDIIRLRTGDRVPADVRLMESQGLHIEESALTGESLPTAKQTQAVGPDTGIGDRKSMAFSGTIVTTGRGIGIVTSTGEHTQIGQINRMISEVRTLATPLTRQMAAFSKSLSIVILALAGLMFLTGWMLHDYTLSELFFASIGFAVAAIPEGLPAILTITLAIGVQSMARQKAITRKLASVETLGSVTVICSDKTGTLTRNEMTVNHVVTTQNKYHVEGIGYSPEGKITLENKEVSPDQAHHDLWALIEVMAVSNDSEINLNDDGHWVVTGEPTEGALCSLARKAGFEHSRYRRIAAIPFESENKFMATLSVLPESDQSYIFMKGAPDRLLDRCHEQLDIGGGTSPLDRDFWNAQIDDLGAKGLRVLAAARRKITSDKSSLTLDDLDQDMVFVGLAGIIDPPRPEAIEAIALCRAAGIQVKMITGDHSGTACAIARQMGISDEDQAISGAELEQANEEELRKIVKDHNIFARTSPEHKLRLVKALQANGQVVAMTGDGVNDAPALKRADVGVAMGIKGTEATKEAADIVLADDNFATIERAVEQGRTIYDNLRKAILFILPTNGAEALVILIAVSFGLILPLTPVQILWVNMVTAVTLAIALAFEPPEPGIMNRHPRDPKARIMDLYFIWRVAFVSLLIGGATITVFLVEKHLGLPIEVARTMAVNTLVCGQVFYLLNSRYIHESSIRLALFYTNPVVWIAIGALAVLQLGYVYIPLMNTAFGSAPMDFRHWLIPMGIGLCIFFIVEAEKAFFSWRQKKV